MLTWALACYFPSLIGNPRHPSVACTHPSDAAHAALRKERHPALKGEPLSPAFDDANTVLLRYMYDGGVLSQGRLCPMRPSSPVAVSGEEVLAALRDDDVDLERFYACIYETAASSGGWLRVDGDNATCNNWRIGMTMAGWGNAVMRVQDDDGVALIDGLAYADNFHVVAGVAEVCLPPSRCYHVTVEGGSSSAQTYASLSAVTLDEFAEADEDMLSDEEMLEDEELLAALARL